MRMLFKLLLQCGLLLQSHISFAQTTDSLRLLNGKLTGYTVLKTQGDQIEKNLIYGKVYLDQIGTGIVIGYNRYQPGLLAASSEFNIVTSLDGAKAQMLSIDCNVFLKSFEKIKAGWLILDYKTVDTYQSPNRVGYPQHTKRANKYVVLDIPNAKTIRHINLHGEVSYKSYFPGSTLEIDIYTPNSTIPDTVYTFTKIDRAEIGLGFSFISLRHMKVKLNPKPSHRYLRKHSKYFTAVLEGILAPYANIEGSYTRNRFTASTYPGYLTKKDVFPSPFGVRLYISGYFSLGDYGNFGAAYKLGILKNKFTFSEKGISPILSGGICYFFDRKNK